MVWRLYRADPVPAIAVSPALDSAALNSYLQLIPINRFPGGALVRASVFRLEWGD